MMESWQRLILLLSNHMFVCQFHFDFKKRYKCRGVKVKSFDWDQARATECVMDLD